MKKSKKSYLKIHKKIVLIIIVIVIVLVSGLIIYGINNSKKDEFSNLPGHPTKYKPPKKRKHRKSPPYTKFNYEITANGECSCISFEDNHKFFEDSCDGEPSHMAYSGEIYKKYKFNRKKKTIVFSGEMGEVEIEVLKWTEDQFKIRSSDSGIPEKCSSNGDDIYTYYRTKFIEDGAYTKKYLNKLKDKDIKLSYYSKEKSLANYDIGQSDYEIVDMDKIISEFNDDIPYTVNIQREKDGKISGMSIRKWSW